MNMKKARKMSPELMSRTRENSRYPMSGNITTAANQQQIVSKDAVFPVSLIVIALYTRNNL